MDETRGSGRPPEHVVNEHITLRLEGEETIIYVDGKPFEQCKFLFATIDLENAREYDEIGSIDELSGALDRWMEEYPVPVGISPEDIFWGHCSNLQAWAEHGYDTRLLHSNLAFPLLKRLAELGDEVARHVFKGEILKRLASGYKPTIVFLVKEGYANHLDTADLSGLLADVASAPNNETIVPNLFSSGVFDRLHPAESMGFLEEWVREKEGFLEERVHEKSACHAISRDEAVVLVFLELLVGGPIPRVDKLEVGSSGFTAEGGHVTGLKVHNGLAALPAVIGRLASLHRLDLYLNNLTSLPEAMGQLESLKELDLSRNKFASLPEVIGELESLDELVLTDNKLTSLPEAIGRLSSLKRLDLSSNDLVSLPEAIGKLSSLEYISLSFNKLTSLPEAIGDLQSLKELIIIDNKLTSLPETIGDLQSLQHLNLMGNQLASLPETIGGLASLQELRLSFNNLTSLPETIGRLKSLTFLSLSDNESLSLPESMEAKLKALKENGCSVVRV